MSNSRNNGALIIILVLVLPLIMVFGLVFFRQVISPGVSFPSLMLPFGLDGFFEIVTIPFRIIPGIFPILLFALWIFILVWVYNDAEKKGMNGVLWALLVFFGNFIALIIYLIVRNDNVYVGNQTLQSTASCPACGSIVVQTYTYCPKCGTKLQASCPKCHKPTVDEWKVCPHCGTHLQAE